MPVDGTAELKELARAKREQRDARAAAAARGASCQVRVELNQEGGLAVGAQLASGVLLRLPCGPCLVTAAHALGEDRAARRSCAARISGVAAVLPGHLATVNAGRGNERDSQILASGAVRFKGCPGCFWRHDHVLDVVVVAVRANSAQHTHFLREVSLPLEQLASAASLRGWTSGSPVQLTHRLGITVAIMRSTASCGDTRAASLQTRSGAPLILDYDAPLAAGTSGAAVYDTRWRLAGVHVRGDELEARGRGVSIDAVRELIEVGNKVPLSTRVRLVQPEMVLETSCPHGSPAASCSCGEDALAATATSPNHATDGSSCIVESALAPITKNRQANVVAQETLCTAAYDEAVGVVQPTHAWSMPLASARIIAAVRVAGWKPRSSGRRVLDNHVRQTEEVRRPAFAPPPSSALSAAMSRDGASLPARGGQCERDAGSEADSVSLQALALREAARAAREAASQRLRSNDVCG